ncbi:MAG: type II toxin-antitoxin system VapC family toxin [Nanoarchaeota archaeon]|nr:type II toxin-antitoxin system VapC family toxin [Nanoarchaeota archaeon]
MYCLDTNIIIEFLRGNSAIIKKIEEVSEYEDIFLNPVTVCELFKGVYISPKSDEELKAVESFVNSFDILIFNIDVYNEFGKIYSLARKSGNLVDDFDLIIAAFAKAYNLVLVTRNKKHFEKSGIKIEVW